MKLTVFFGTVVFSFVANAEVSKLNYGPCIKAINEKSVILKDSIYPLSADGQSFAFTNSEGNLIVVGENGTYKLSKKPVKCSASTDFDTFSTMQSLVVMTTAFNNDPKNSDDNKREIVSKCKDFIHAPMKSGFPGSNIPGFK